MGLVVMVYGLLKSVQIDKNECGISFFFEISYYVKWSIGQIFIYL